jgi:hypothetical protein
MSQLCMLLGRFVLFRESGNCSILGIGLGPMGEICEHVIGTVDAILTYQQSDSDDEPG